MEDTTQRTQRRIEDNGNGEPSNFETLLKQSKFLQVVKMLERKLFYDISDEERAQLKEKIRATLEEMEEIRIQQGYEIPQEEAEIVLVQPPSSAEEALQNDGKTD